MHTRCKKRWLGFLVTVLVVSVMTIPASAREIKLQNDEIRITDSANKMTESGGVVTITASGGLFSQTTNTINIYNETKTQCKLTFNYAANNYGSFSESAKGDAGPYEAVLGAGGNVTLSIKGKRAVSNNTATLTLSGITLQAMSDASNVTFVYDSALGSVTVGGTPVANNGVVEIASSGAVLTATPVTGATFYGWVAADNKILSTAASYTLTPATDLTVKAVFGSAAKPCFGVGVAAAQQHSTGLLGLTKHTHYAVGGYEYLFDDLNAAGAVAATSGTAKAVVLLNSATLPEGTYTIPAGVTLLVPFNTSNTMYTTEPEHSDTTTEVPSTVYRTLTLAENATIAVNGSISVSAKHKHVDGDYCEGGYPTGEVGMIKMAKNSSITVNNGGALYAWGYISALSATSEGSITAMSGAKVYESFQIMDYRGGSQSSDMSNGVFPMSQYYVQNIEVPLEVKAGAEEICAVTMYGSGMTVFSSFPFMGTGAEGHIGMFNIFSGSVTKRYNGSRDRLELTVAGNMDVATLTLKLNPSSSSGISSKDYVLCLNNNISVNVLSGILTVKQDLALLPGCELTVGENAKIVLANNGNNSPSKLYVYDADQWGNFCYTEGIPPAAGRNDKLIPARYAPGRTYIRTAGDLQDVLVKINGLVDATGGYIYTTAGGANVCSDGGGSIKLNPTANTNTYQFVQGTGYTTIPVTSVKLKNVPAAYPYTETAKYSGTVTYYYDSTEGVWRPEVAQRYDASGNPVGDPYTSLAKAIADQPNNSGYIRMTRDSYYENITTNKAVYLDLNGCTVNLNGTATFGTLYGMDTTTNAFGAGNNYTYGSLNGTITGTVADHHRYAGTGKYYATSLTGNTYSFHRFDLGVEKYTFYKAGDKGTLVFDMVVKGDEKALAEIAKTGAYIFDTESSEYQWTPDKAVKYSGHIALSEEQFAKLINVQAAVQMADANATPIVNDRENFYARQISLQALLDAMNNGGAG